MATATVAEISRAESTFTLHKTIVKTEYDTILVPASTAGTTSAPTKSTISRTSLETLASTSSSSPVPQASGATRSQTTLMSSASMPYTASNILSTTSSVVAVPSTSTASSSWTLSPLQSDAPLSTPSTTTSDSAKSSSRSQEHAIVGGLSGAIAGLVMVGVLVAFCLRRRVRRRPTYEDHESATEKGFRPALSRKWTELTGRGTLQETWQPPQAEVPVTVDEDHHIIRMNTKHWPRPYAQGQGEGWRESVAPGTLRVVNPDDSRPATPVRMPSETAESFLKKQRHAIVAVIASANRSRANSQPTQHPTSPGQVPNISIDPALSRECIAPTARAPSFMSYPSIRSSAVVTQQPPEDPFLTPPEENADSKEQKRPKRPSLAPLQHAAGAATRTLSSFGNALNPFRGKSNVSMRTSSTWSSRFSKRGTGQFSDPFDLWVHKPPSHTGGPTNDGKRCSGNQWSLYEGT